MSSAPAARSVAARAVRGSASVAAASYAGFVLSFVGTASVARYVGPGEFGAYALAQAYNQILVAFGGFAFTQAVLQSESESPELANTATLLTLAVRGVLLALAVPLAWLVTHVHGEAVGTSFLILGGVQFIEAAKVSYGMPLQRRVEFGRVAWTGFTGSVVAQGAAVWAALAGWGISALVLRDALVSAVPLAVLLSRQRAWGLPSGVGFNRESARTAWHFGRSVWLVRLLEQGLSRLDSVVLGALFSLSQVGLFQQARYIGSLPSSAVGPGNLAVALSTYSRLHHDRQRLAKAFDIVQYFVVRIVPPFAILCVAFPDLLVTVVLGPKWVSALGPLQMAGAYALLLPILDSFRTLAVAMQRWRLLRWSSVVQLLVALPLTVLFARFQATGAVAALSLGTFVAIIVLALAMRPVAAVGTGARYVPVLAATASALLFGAALRRFTPVGTPAIASAALGTIAAYVCVLLIMEARELRRRIAYVLSTLSVRDRQDPHT